MRAPALTLRAASPRPFAVDAIASVVPRTMRWRAAEARTASIVIEQPSGTIRTARDGSLRAVRWAAPAARWSGARFARPAGHLEVATMRSRATWARVKGPGPLVLGRGEVVFRTKARQVRIDHGHVEAAGGRVSMGAFVANLDEPRPLVVRARGLQLARVLAVVGRGRVDGAGTLDGTLELRLDDAGASLTSAILKTRGAGNLRVRDPGLRTRLTSQLSTTSLDIHQRIIGALVDFDYAHVSAALAPPGTDPEIRIAVRGRGRRAQRQALDLTFNVRGVRDAVDRLVHYTDRSP